MHHLDHDLRRTYNISLTEYEILVRLSETQDGQMRMANLADAIAHTRSRVTHTIARMEDATSYSAPPHPRTAAASRPR